MSTPGSSESRKKMNPPQDETQPPAAGSAPSRQVSVEATGHVEGIVHAGQTHVLTFPEYNVGASLPPAAFLENARYSFSSPETPEQLAHNRDMEKLKEGHRQRMEVASWWGGIGLTVVLVAICAAAFFHTSNADVQKLAIGAIASFFTGWIGFVAGLAKGKAG
jgi:hypothetical protein